MGVYIYVAELFPEPGVALWEKIKSMILRSDLIIVLWTKNAYSSAFLNQELGFAEAHNKLIVPIVETGNLRNGFGILFLVALFAHPEAKNRVHNNFIFTSSPPPFLLFGNLANPNRPSLEHTRMRRI